MRLAFAFMLAAAPALAATPSTNELLAGRFLRCWNLGTLSRYALDEEVSVSFAVFNGTVTADSISPAAAFENAAQKQLYESARRAIIRCGAKKLPTRFGSFVATFTPAAARISVSSP